jgi:FMN-dependent NADH-azoreductase
MNLLHLDSSILGHHSVSRTLSAAAVAKIRQGNPDLRVTYRDLAAEPIPHLSGAYLAAAQSPAAQHDQGIQHDLALGGRVLDEFLAADVVVIGVAFYNFTVSTQLKAWIDRVVIAGKTFRYTERGSEGLVGNKRVVLAIARGGYYGEASPVRSSEHAETYLRTILAFMGIVNPEIVTADGIAVGPEQREAAVKAGLEQAAALPAAA